MLTPISNPATAMARTNLLDDDTLRHETSCAVAAVSETHGQRYLVTVGGYASHSMVSRMAGGDIPTSILRWLRMSRDLSVKRDFRLADVGCAPDCRTMQLVVGQANRSIDDDIAEIVEHLGAMRRVWKSAPTVDLYAFLDLLRGELADLEAEIIARDATHRRAA